MNKKPGVAVPQNKTLFVLALALLQVQSTTWQATASCAEIWASTSVGLILRNEQTAATHLSPGKDLLLGNNIKMKVRLFP